MPRAEQPIKTCPYTGDPITVEPVLGRGWVPVGLFDPSRWFDSEDEARRALGMRGGEQRGSDRCPYSGRRLKLVLSERLGKWRASTFFAPVKVYPTEGDAWYELSFRNGVAPAFPRHPDPVQVRSLRPEPPGPADGLGQGLGDFAGEFIEEITKQ
jgi:hypothetical protein